MVLQCSSILSSVPALLGWTNHLANTQDAQQMAGRWSEKRMWHRSAAFSPPKRK